MKRTILVFSMVALLLTGCTGTAKSPEIAPREEVSQPSPLPTEELSFNLPDDQVKTLQSLERVDSYPLYTMVYSGEYRQLASANADVVGQIYAPKTEISWACTLFASLANEEIKLYGRNFDWEYSPAMLLFTDPPNGYASVSMVDLTYLGFSSEEISQLDELPVPERTALLEAPWWPFDGMNEEGLVIGMAAVPASAMPQGPEKPTIGSLEIMRKVLDGASDVNEALEIMSSYNIDMRGGPAIHYLIADRFGEAILVEFYRGEIQVLPNEQPWHIATNFLQYAVSGSLEGIGWRYDRVLRAMEKSGGGLSGEQALTLLGEVSQTGTQWSVVYGSSTGLVQIAMGRDYENVLSFQLDLSEH
jgi:hypothetical protein